MTTTNGKSQEVRFGKQRIPFTLEFRARQRLAIHVHPDRSVSVAAPTGRSVEEVIQRVQKRAGWIAKQRAYFDQFHPMTPPRRFVAGETHFFLGRQYRLKLTKSDSENVKLIGRYLTVSLPDRDDNEMVKTLLRDWYRERATDVFDRRVVRCLQMAPSLKLTAPDISVRLMTKRWGSCTRTGRVLLNVELVKTPIHCIEYVIMHELCHLKIYDHSERFYRLLSRCLPDWKRRKQRLESYSF